MRYVLAIHYDESDLPPEGSPEADELWAAYNRFTQELADAGAFEAADALQPVAMACTLTDAGDETIVTDGPFAETKEHLGGFYLIQCSDMAAAVEWGRRCPGVTHGSVEVRPVLEMGLARDPEFLAGVAARRETTCSTSS